MWVRGAVVVAVAVVGKGQWAWWWLGGARFVWLFFNGLVARFVVGFLVGLCLDICWVCGGFLVMVVAMWCGFGVMIVAVWW